MPRRTRFLSLVAAGLALAVGASACGGSSDKKVAAAAVETTTSTTGDPRAAYNACLKQHGVDLPDRPARTSTTVAGTPAGQTTSTSQGTQGSRPPGTRVPGGGGNAGSTPPGSRPGVSLPAGVTQADFDAARQACQSLLPADNGPGNGGQGQAFQAYTSCMKDHGVTVGGPGGGGPGGGGPGGANRDDAAFKAADQICAPLRPTTTITTVPAKP